MREKVLPPIEIKDVATRHEIVQKIVNIFINSEHQERGRGVRFRYPVERFSDGTQLFIIRPGGLQKWNFDFKVDVKPAMGLGKGTHKDIELDIRNKRNENPANFSELMLAITRIYECSETDVDRVLEEYPNLPESFKSGANVEVLLKVLKWMFIMEDIVYWNYDGRLKLYNYLKGI